jgi:hypothetical protein
MDENGVAPRESAPATFQPYPQRSGDNFAALATPASGNPTDSLALHRARSSISQKTTNTLNWKLNNDMRVVGDLLRS